MTVTVVGAGVFGAWTAYALQSAGAQVTLIDKYGPANSRASSGGESRIIRCGYGPDEIYTRMAQRSLGLWSDLCDRTGLALLHRTGVLWMSTPDETSFAQTEKSLTNAGVAFRELGDEELASTYPQMRLAPGTKAILEPQSGALMARQSVQALVREFVKRGGTYLQAAAREPKGSGTLTCVTTQASESIFSDAFVFACGSWLRTVFSSLLGQRIFPTRQEVLFFGVPEGDLRFASPQLPVWIDFHNPRPVYGFPDLEHRGLKMAFDNHGPEFHPDVDDRVISGETIREAREYLAMRFPDLRDAPLLDSRVCPYENTSSGDFLIDRHPDFHNVWLAGGGSGHGFKHGPAVGEYVAARVLGNGGIPPEPRFSLASKQTGRQRTVH